jgi:hypothetical protein
MSKNIGTLLNAARSYDERAHTSRLVSSWSSETSLEYQKATAQLLAEVQDLKEQEETENANPMHSPVARFEAVKGKVQKFMDKLKWLRDQKIALENRIRNLHGELFLLPDSELNEAVQVQRDVVIWNMIGQMTPNERDNQYLRSSETDQTEILRAIQNAPFPLVMDETRLRADDQRAARLQPPRYRTYVELGELVDELTVILGDCLDLGREFGLDVSPINDGLGEKIRETLDFAVQHTRARGKKTLATTAKDVVPAPV